MAAIIGGLLALTAAACAADPTDPGNVAPVRLLNDTSDRIHVSWCPGDDTQCKERRQLGDVKPEGRAVYKISSYEVVFRLEAEDGAAKYLCKDGAEGSTMEVSKSVSDLKSAFKNC
ncbi:hypothetical protein ABZZ74_40480 [Streptomyces sp. NPDC006476]|uniref:hypothetical protein n=1 Tax=Streptomyces sp. NPDC006476 TaxID=3157175 RepID=UPI0033B894C8